MNTSLPVCCFMLMLFLCLNAATPSVAIAQSQYPSLEEYSKEQRKKRKPTAPEQPEFPYNPPDMLDPVLEGGDDNPFILPEPPPQIPLPGPAILLLGGTAYALRRLGKNRKSGTATSPM